MILSSDLNQKAPFWGVFVETPINNLCECARIFKSSAIAVQSGGFFLDSAFEKWLVVNLCGKDLYIRSQKNALGCFAGPRRPALWEFQCCNAKAPYISFEIVLFSLNKLRSHPAGLFVIPVSLVALIEMMFSLFQQMISACLLSALWPGQRLRIEPHACYWHWQDV